LLYEPGLKSYAGFRSRFGEGEIESILDLLWALVLVMAQGVLSLAVD